MNIAQKMWSIDPGNFKLKNAFKTTLGMVVAIFLADQLLGKMPAVLAGFGAVFLTQGIMDDPWKKRLFALFLVAFASLSMYTASALLKPNPIHVEILLIILAFFTLYVRRFGPRFMLPPINVWALCLIGGILPQEPPSLVLENGLGYVIGVLCACAVHFSVFSLDKRYLFFENIEQLRDVFVESLLWLEQYFINGVPRHVFLEKNRDLHNEIVKLVTINEGLLEAMTYSDLAQARKFGKNQMITYALQKDFSILFEGFSGLTESRIEITLELKQLLLSAFLHLSFLIQQVKVEEKAERIYIDKNLVPFEDYLEKIQNYLNAMQVEARDEILPILNICLGLRLIWRNLW